MMKNAWQKLRIVSLLGLLLLAIGIPVYATQDTEPPVVDWDSVEVSKSVITDPFEKPIIKLKVSDESEIQQVSVSYTINGKLNAASAILEYNSATGYYEGEVQYNHMDSETSLQKGFYGDYVFLGVNAVDVYGNTTNAYDVNVPTGNFSVVSDMPKDDIAPNIDWENIVISSTISVGGSGMISVPISDESEIYEAYAYFTHKNSGSISKVVGLSKSANGNYEGKIKFEESENAPEGG